MSNTDFAQSLLPQGWKADPKIERPLPSHLGGHDNITQVDEGALHTLKDATGAKSMLDVGCGPGGQVLLARQMGLKAQGVDGDWGMRESLPDLILHDYATGPYVPLEHWDMAWCVELLEHLKEWWLPNVFRTFRRCGLVVATHALPGTEAAHHHVNCRTEEYWNWQFRTRGFVLDGQLAALVRKASTMKRDFMRETGKVYRNKAWR